MISPSFSHPVLDLLAARDKGESDSHTLALAVEGGGMAGSVSAGMCMVLEQLDLIKHFDIVVGSSAGALNGSYSTAGQARLGATNYTDCAGSRFISRRRLLQGRPVMDMNFLFESVMNQKPYDMTAFRAGPRFACLACCLDDSPQRALRVLDSFDSEKALRQAVQASCQIPGLAGQPVIINDQPLVDGALIESIPYDTALELGATHVLVLRSYSEEHKKQELSLAELTFVRMTCPQALPLVKARSGLYNQQADRLRRPDDRILQITPDRDLCTSFERRAVVMRGAMAGGASAAAQVLLGREVQVRWQPAVELAGLSPEQRPKAKAD